MKLHYDLGRAPPTFDFVSFLCAAERHRKIAGEDSFDLVIVPGPKDGFRDDALWPPPAERRMMLHRVVIPLASLLPSVSLISIEPEVPEIRTRYGHHILMQAFASGCRPLRAEPEDRGGPYVTITLREAEHWPQRNSNVPEWLKAVPEIEKRGFEVVIIRDTAKAGETLRRAIPTAAIDIAHRARLYAGAALNLGVSNGPMWMAAAMDTPVAIFRPVSDAPACSEKFFRKAGMEPGNPHPWNAAHQTVIWVEDTADTIMAAFEAAIVKELA